MKALATRLCALTPEARYACGAREFEITTFPFRAGRESRRLVGCYPDDSPQRRELRNAFNNDLYLIDEMRPKSISREHFEIHRDPNGAFTISDRASACGTMVGNRLLGGDRRAEQMVLNNENVILLGGAGSPYAFQFFAVHEAASTSSQPRSCPPLADRACAGELSLMRSSP